jgi:hypothetical protein
MPMAKATLLSSSRHNNTGAAAKSSPMATVGTLPAVALPRCLSASKDRQELPAPALSPQQRSTALRSPRHFETAE